MTAIAFAPMMCVLLALACRIRAIYAALLGLLVAGIGTVLWFPVERVTVLSAIDSMWATMLAVALILLGGVGLSDVMTRSGAQRTIADWLLHASQDRSLMLLLTVYGITPFMESVTGFGLGVVASIPLLIQFGVKPAKAAVVALLGLVLVPWGSLGPGTLVAATLGGIPFQSLGIVSAWFTLPVLLVSVPVVMHLVFDHAEPRPIGLAAATVSVLWLSLLAANYIVAPPVAGVLASTCVVVFLLLVSYRRYGTLPRLSGAVLRAILPYLVLSGGLLISHAVLALTHAALTYGFLASPALWLLLTLLFAMRLSHSPNIDWRSCGVLILKKWWPIMLSTMAFMVLGLVLANNGMAVALARSAAHTGEWFHFIAPALGVLGGYMTGSNVGSAAMFSAATTLAADQATYDPLIALGGQNVAASFAIILSPPRIALAASLAMGLGAALPAQYVRVLIGVVLTLALALGLVTWFWSG